MKFDYVFALDSASFSTVRPTDRAALEALYPAAFPDEDLLPLVRQLLDADQAVSSFVAVIDGALAGHIAFTRCGLEGQAATLALLGPLAVHPDNQRQGVGGALIRHGLGRVEEGGAYRVLVLGDPAFYGRYGFTAEKRVAPPYDIPDDWKPAWQSLRLGGPDARLRGKLTVPPPWRNPALWAP